ncbi:hemin-degrading factor [Comamonas odontotermitis]|uniref:hemin-degrading factor n=1 Tax=Comamonas odontotermitis TaxID=379895 RepID=UPI001CC41941|nr:ChuX/HutX family heme-like substrate-binding protein [Comamonas odontotermitis]UBB15928.1 hemin-degrading factor [Comamonas odontotermitis]
MITTKTKPAALTSDRAAQVREAYAVQRAKGLRAKDAAEAAGSSEGEAIAAHAVQLLAADAHETSTLQVQPLQAPQGGWIEVLKALEPCGPVMALTRNASTVHEKTGIYTQLSASGEPGMQVGLAVGEDIDLRLFFAGWHAAYAVQEASAHGGSTVLRSLQFYNRAGRAVHKVFAREVTDLAAWGALVARFACAADVDVAALPGFDAPAPRKAVSVPPDSSVDVPALQAAWAAMQDTHEFFSVIKNAGAERQQSFRLVQERFAWPLAKDSVTQLLNEASFAGTPIMVFVSSGGCIQIHSGPVQRVEPMTTPTAEWINVLDTGFNLHMRTDMIANVWLVEKPTSDGTVTSVEVFDAYGDLMAMFFGARKPGKPELAPWRALATSLPRLDAQAVAA